MKVLFHICPSGSELTLSIKTLLIKLHEVKMQITITFEGWDSLENVLFQVSDKSEIENLV